MEPVEVTARWGADGDVAPLSFQGKAGPVTVAVSGRHWKDEEGLHVLVQGADGRAYELVFHPAEMRWFLGFQRRSPAVI